MLPAAHREKRSLGWGVGSAGVGVAVVSSEGGSTDASGEVSTSETLEAASWDKDWSITTASSAALVRTSVWPVSLGKSAQNPPSTHAVNTSMTTVPSETLRLGRLRRLMEGLLSSGKNSPGRRHPPPGLDQPMKQ